MIIFYDEATSNQVQALYSGDTSSLAWAAFTKVEVTDPTLVRQLLAYERNCKVTIVESEVTVVTENDHPDDHTLAIHKAERKALVDQKTKELICCKYCENTFAAANTAIETVVDGGQTLKTNIDAAADQGALGAIVDERS